jgi:hypothetical protein
MNKQAKEKITDIQQIPFTKMGISKQANVWHIRTQLSAIAAVIFAAQPSDESEVCTRSDGPNGPLPLFRGRSESRAW